MYVKGRRGVAVTTKYIHALKASTIESILISDQYIISCQYTEFLRRCKVCYTKYTKRTLEAKNVRNHLKGISQSRTLACSVFVFVFCLFGLMVFYVFALLFFIVLPANAICWNLLYLILFTVATFVICDLVRRPWDVKFIGHFVLFNNQCGIINN